MPSKNKPYRVYRGGRARGPIQPLSPPREAPSPPADGHPPVEVWAPSGPPGYPEGPGLPPRRRRRRAILWVGLALLALALLLVAWVAAGYLSFRGGVEEANRRLPASAAAALAPATGSILTSPTTVLLLGVDTGPGRPDQGRSDSIVLVRIDPDSHRIALLSIPRDLRVRIPGYGSDKINAAYAYGGPALAIRTVEELTGIPVNHVAVVDFSTFDDMIDALGGVTIDVPRKIVSNRFDCPYGTQARCERWPGWQFQPGRQTMDGRRALVYARIRENRLDPTESDLTRGGRQQQVVQAIAGELVSPMGFLRLPFVGGDVVKPLATDLSAFELLQLGWVEFRASDEASLRCRLGGQPEEVDGVWYLSGTEENASVIAMVKGETAPQPPRPDSGLFAPGCTVGS